MSNACHVVYSLLGNQCEPDQVPVLTELYERGMEAVVKLTRSVNDTNAGGDRALKDKRTVG